jgi:hypothetical protein
VIHFYASRSQALEKNAFRSVVRTAQGLQTTVYEDDTFPSHVYRFPDSNHIVNDMNTRRTRPDAEKAAAEKAKRVEGKTQTTLHAFMNTITTSAAHTIAMKDLSLKMKIETKLKKKKKKGEVSEDESEEEDVEGESEAHEHHVQTSGQQGDDRDEDMEDVDRQVVTKGTTGKSGQGEEFEMQVDADDKDMEDQSAAPGRPVDFDGEQEPSSPGSASGRSSPAPSSDEEQSDHGVSREQSRAASASTSKGKKRMASLTVSRRSVSLDVKGKKKQEDVPDAMQTDSELEEELNGAQYLTLIVTSHILFSVGSRMQDLVLTAEEEYFLASSTAPNVVTPSEGMAPAMQDPTAACRW